MAATTAEKRVDVWKNRIVRAYRARRDLEATWDKLYDFYNGRNLLQKIRGDQYTVNWTMPIVRQMASSLYFQDPQMDFQALTMAGQVAAPIAEQAIALERNICGASGEERKALINGLLYGTGILKSGYNAEYGVATPFAKGAIKSDGDDSASEDAILQQAPFTEFNARINRGHAWQSSVDPWDFLIDPEANDYETARWACHHFVRPWLAVVRDERYDAQVRKEIKPSGRGASFDETVFFGETDNWKDTAEGVDSSLVSLYEIEDKWNKRIIVISDQCKKPLMDIACPFIMKEGIYSILRFIPDDRSFWGAPYADTFSPQVLSLNKLRDHAMDHLQKWGVVRAAYLANRGVSHAQMTEWIRDGIDSVIALSGADSIKDLVQFFPQVQISGDAWQLMSAFQDDLNKVSGWDELSMGGTSNRTATADSIQAQHTGLRVSDMRHQLELFLRDGVRKMLGITRQFWGNERIVPLFGPGGQLWNEVRVPQETLYAEFDVGIQANSTERVDDAVRRRQIIDATQVLVPMEPLLNAQGFAINWPEFVREYMRTTQIFPNPSKALIQLPPPQPQPEITDQSGGQSAGQPAGNVVPFPAQQAQQVNSMTPQAEPMNMNGQMQSQGAPFDMQRMLSEANFGGGV